MLLVLVSHGSFTYAQLGSQLTQGLHFLILSEPVLSLTLGKLVNPFMLRFPKTQIQSDISLYPEV